MFKKYKFFIAAGLIPFAILPTTILTSCVVNNPTNENTNQNIEQPNNQDNSTSIPNKPNSGNNQTTSPNQPSQPNQSIKLNKLFNQGSYSVSNFSLEGWEKIDNLNKNKYKTFSNVLPHVFSNKDNFDTVKEIIKESLINEYTKSDFLNKSKKEIIIESLTKESNEQISELKVKLTLNNDSVEITLNGFAPYSNNLYNIEKQLDNQINNHNNYKWVITQKDGIIKDWLVIPHGVTHIGDNGFLKSQIKEIVLPNSLIEIGISAFRNSMISNIIIPENVKKINSLSFNPTTNLRKIIINTKYNELNKHIYGDMFVKGIFGTEKKEIIFTDKIIMQNFLNINGTQNNLDINFKNNIKY